MKAAVKMSCFGDVVYLGLVQVWFHAWFWLQLVFWLMVVLTSAFAPLSGDAFDTLLATLQALDSEEGATDSQYVMHGHLSASRR